MYTVLLRNCSVTRLAMAISGGGEGGKCPVTWNDWIIAPRGPGARVGNYFAAPGKWAGGRGTESSGMPMDGARTMRRPGCLGASRINIAFRGDVRAAAAGNSRPFATADHPPSAPLLTTR